MTVSFGSFYDLCYVLFVKTAVPAEIFKAVPVVRKMAGCYHYSAVTFETLKDSGHEHGRGGRKPAVVYKDAGCRQALADGSLELFCCYAAVVANGYGQPADGFSGLFGKPFAESFRQSFGFFFS